MIFKIDIKDVSKEISSYTQLNGRFDTNLIDGLNGAYNYGMTKRKMSAHIDSKELNLIPFKSGSIGKYSSSLSHRAKSKIDSLHYLTH